NEKKEYILDFPNYQPTLEQAVGKYYFVPIVKGYRDDYKYLNLNQGDTLFLEINKDSTYLFNKFYYNQGKVIDSLLGKVHKIGENTVAVSPSSTVKNARIYLSGFKKSPQTGLHYYYGINSPTDSTEFEYYIIFKKLSEDVHGQKL